MVQSIYIYENGFSHAKDDFAEAYAIEEGVSYRIVSKEEMQQEMEAAKKRQENKS